MSIAKKEVVIGTPKNVLIRHGQHPLEVADETGRRSFDGEDELTSSPHHSKFCSMPVTCYWRSTTSTMLSVAAWLTAIMVFHLTLLQRKY
jgi:hypothetical protein